MKRLALIALVALVAPVAPAFADVTVKSTGSGKGMGMDRAMSITTYIKGNKMRTDTDTFSSFVTGRANRGGTFFIRPAGGVDLCNVNVPVRRVQG